MMNKLPIYLQGYQFGVPENPNLIKATLVQSFKTLEKASQTEEYAPLFALKALIAGKPVLPKDNLPSTVSPENSRDVRSLFETAGVLPLVFEDGQKETPEEAAMRILFELSMRNLQFLLSDPYQTYDNSHISIAMTSLQILRGAIFTYRSVDPYGNQPNPPLDEGESLPHYVGRVLDSVCAKNDFINYTVDPISLRENLHNRLHEDISTIFRTGSFTIDYVPQNYSSKPPSFILKEDSPDIVITLGEEEEEKSSPDLKLNPYRFVMIIDSDGKEVVSSIRITERNRNSPLGAGGAATVYEAEEVLFPDGDTCKGTRRIAFKLTHSDKTQEIYEAAQNEVVITSELDGVPGVVRVFGCGFAINDKGEKVPFTSLQLIEGETFSAYLKRQGTSDPTTVISYLCEIVETLEQVHSRAIAHLDLKPQNVIISAETGKPVLCDFGISKRSKEISHSENDPKYLKDRLPAGSTSYMSPEMLIIMHAKIFAEQSIALADVAWFQEAFSKYRTDTMDVFSFGMMAYRSLSGSRQPFEGMDEKDTDQRAQAYLNNQLKYISLRHYNPQVPRWLDRIIRKCLSVDPEGRYPSMTEVAAIFEKHQPGRHQKRSFESALKALQIKKEPDPLDIRTALQALRAWDQALFVAEDYSALVDELYPAAKILEPYLTSLELAGILYRHGRVLARTGHITDAANFFSDAEALVEGRHDLDTLKLRASIYLDSAYFSGLGVMKDYLDKTLKVFQEIEARNPDQLMKQIAALKSRLSESRASSLEVEASDIEAVDVSLIHISDFIDPILRGRFWYLKAILARKDKNYEQAHEFAKKAQAILHGDYQWTVNIQALIGYIYIDQKDFDKAIEMLNQLRRTIEASETIAHNGMAVYVNLGEALYRSDRFEEAQEVLEVGLYEYGDQRYMAELYKYLFLVYLKMNNFEKAQNIFNKRKGDKGDLFVELQDPIAQLTFARMSQVNREYTMAEQVFYSLKDNDSLDLQHRLEVYDSLAAIYIQLKKTAELKAEIEELKNICQDTSIPKKERLLFFELAQSLEKKCFEMED